MSKHEKLPELLQNWFAENQIDRDYQILFKYLLTELSHQKCIKIVSKVKIVKRICKIVAIFIMMIFMYYSKNMKYWDLNGNNVKMLFCTFYCQFEVPGSTGHKCILGQYCFDKMHTRSISFSDFHLSFLSFAILFSFCQWFENWWHWSSAWD